MKTLLFCTSYIADESQWQQRYGPWLEHHRGSALAADAIVMIDDHSSFLPPSMTVLPASRIGQDALPSEALIRFSQHLGRAQPLDFPGWWRGMLASVCLALHYGFERIIHVESDSLILSEQLSNFLASRTSGWTALWCPESNGADDAIQVLCRDAFHLVEQLAALGPFAFRDQPPARNLPFTNIEKGFIGACSEELKQIPANADYATHSDFAAAPPTNVAATKRQPASLLQPVALRHAVTDQVTDDEQHLALLCKAFPQDAQLMCRYGIAAYQGGNLVAARAALERSDWLQPEVGMTCKFLGAARMQQGELAGAAAAAVQSARLNLGDADAQNMAGAFSMQAGYTLEAIEYFRLALALEPEASSSLSNLALINWNDPVILERFPNGLRGIELEVRRALMERLRINRLTPRGAATLLAFGVHFAEGFEQLVQLARALIAEAASDAQTLFIAGNALVVCGDHEGALAAYRRAALLAPQSDRIQSAVGYASICQGGDLFLEGFRIANEAWPRINPPAFAASPKRWQGSAEGITRLLIYQEQGIGDALICLRLLPLLKDTSINAALWLRPELAALVLDQAGLPLITSELRPDAEQLGFDSVSPLFGLIDALGITADQIPPAPIIKAPSKSVLHFSKKLKALKQLRVGLCLFGNPNRSDDWARSAGDQEISALARLERIDWVNLSVDARPERDTLKRLMPNLTDLASEMKDFEASAALIANLDVVISIDSVIAHLAAALGKPVLLLCPSIADWRWKIGEVESPWWPTVEIFPADKAGDFSTAISAVAARITMLARRHQ